MMFSALPAEAQAALVASSRARAFAEGAIIQQRGEEAGGFYLIEGGSVAVGQFLSSGEFRSIALLGPGDSWGELAMFAQRPRVVDAIARAPSLVRFIPTATFDRVLAGNPQVMRELLGALSSQLQEVLDVMAGIRRGSARPRVAAILATLTRDASMIANIAITQQELAELLGLTRATVNSVLSELEGAGIIARGYGTIRVLDRAALEERALDG